MGVKGRKRGATERHSVTRQTSEDPIWTSCPEEQTGVTIEGESPFSDGRAGPGGGGTGAQSRQEDRKTGTDSSTTTVPFRVSPNEG